MRLSAGISTTDVQIVNIGPFRKRMRPPSRLTVNLRDGAAGSNAVVDIRAAVVDNRATVAADVDGGTQLFSGSPRVWIPGTSGGPSVDSSLPIEALELHGKFIAIEVTTGSAGTVDGWVGIDLIG